MTGPVWHRIEVGVLPDAGVEIDHARVQRAIGEAIGPWTMSYGFRVEPIFPRVSLRQDQPLYLRWSDDGGAIRRWGNEPFSESRTYYPATCLETAACVWEAVLDMERIGDGVAGDPDQEARGAAIRACREAIGSSHLRLTVLGWVDAIDAAWRQVDTDFGQEPRGGCYGEAFDWEFVPAWIVANVDWSEPNGPTLGVIADQTPEKEL